MWQHKNFVQMDRNKIDLIKRFVKIKVEELNKFNQVRYAINYEENTVTRVSYEKFKINEFLNDNNFDKEMTLCYLNKLKISIKKEDIHIYDNLPSSTPDVTDDFLSWIEEAIAGIELKGMNDINKHPEVFNDGKYFKYFEQYVGKHIIETFVDFSYLFQKMLNEGFIKRISHKEFYNWLYKYKYIDEITYNEIDSKGQFRSLSKSESKQRKNNFNITFELN